MKFAILLFSLLGALSFQASAANVDAHLEGRINDACVKSVEGNGSDLPNYKNICRCIANKHFGAALSNSSQEDADKHMAWTLAFYETTDMHTLEKMSADKHGYGTFDDQVIDDCMSDTQGP